MLRADIADVTDDDDVFHIADVAVDRAALAVYHRQAFFAKVKPAAREDFVSRLLEVPHPLAALQVRDVTPIRWFAVAKAMARTRYSYCSRGPSGWGSH